jgi:hypothetical protein
VGRLFIRAAGALCFTAESKKSWDDSGRDAPSRRVCHHPLSVGRPLDRCGSVRGGNAHAFPRARPTRGDARMPWLRALVFVQGAWCFSVRGSGESGSGAEGEFERERLVGDFWPDASALATMKAHEAISYCSRAGHGLCKLFHSRSSCLGQVFHEMAHDQAFAVGARCPVL